MLRFCNGALAVIQIQPFIFLLNTKFWKGAHWLSMRGYEIPNDPKMHQDVMPEARLEFTVDKKELEIGELTG